MIKEYFDFIGKDLSTQEASEKVRGLSKFSTDYHFEGMLYLKLLTSKIDRVDIHRIDFSDLLRINGIVDIFKIPELPYVMICAINEKSLKNAVEIAEKQINISEEILHFEASEHKVTINSVDLKLIDNPLVEEHTYSTSPVFSPYLEPEGGVAYIENKILTVIYPGNDPHKEQQEIVQLLKLPSDSVKVICPSCRAAYGGKGSVPVHLYLATGAYKTGKPVRLMLDGEQTQETGYSHPMNIHLRTGIAEDLSYCGHDIKISVNSGTSYSIDDITIERIKSAFTKTYNTSHCNLELTVNNSENNFSDSFPGEGYLQSVFALETQMDILSKKTKTDPLELRIKLLGNNEKPEALMYKKILLAMKDSDLYKNALLYKRNKDPQIKRGIGIAACMLPVTFKSDKFAEETPAARILINEHRRYQIEISCPDSGKGSLAAFSQIAAEIIGCSIDKIKTVTGSSGLPYPGYLGKGGSVSIAGEYVKKAAEDLKNRLLANGVTAESLKRPSSLPGKLLGTIGTAYHEPVEEYYSGIGNILLLEVNTRYCTIEIKKTENFVYAGTIINPQDLTGSINGAIARSVKYALGTRSYPRINDLSLEVLNHFIESTNNQKDRAFGANSIGEILAVTLTPAILNAFCDATSKRSYSVPLSPPKIYNLLYGDL